jgi:hypothetical protein
MVGFADQCTLEGRAKPLMFFGSEVLTIAEEAHDELADREFVRVAVFERGGQRSRQNPVGVTDSGDNPRGEVILQRKQIAAQQPVVVLGPHVGIRARIDQADVQSNRSSGRSDRSLDEIARAHLLGRQRIGRLPFRRVGFAS